MNVVINLNKPRSLSSQEAVTRVKKALAAKKAGHAGTLDPIATGVLLVCLNEATKIVRFLSDLDKEYVTRLKLGERTDTYDSTGRVIEEKDFRSVTESRVRAVVEKATGFVKQTPPMYSAVKIGGTPLYKLARKGLEIERPERPVHISQIDLISFQPPYVDLRISCSKGTYIRTICDDIGEELGVGAHMVSLIRTRVGNFHVDDSLSLEHLDGNRESFHAIDSVLPGLEEIILDPDTYRRARNGIPIGVHCGVLSDRAWSGEDSCDGVYVRLKSPEKVLFGIGRLRDGEIRIERLLNT